MEQNFEKAVKYYQKALEVGVVSSAALSNLGICYYEGNGVEKNISEAVKYFKEAALGGFPQAQCNLGVCYYRGEGLKKDIVKAYALIAISAAGGYEASQEKLNNLEKEISKEEQAEAKELIKKCDREGLEALFNYGF